jgi:hypothetical protein
MRLLQVGIGLRMPETPLWTNQPLQLYHGTLLTHANAILSSQGVDVSRSRPDCDFGRGFYCTTRRDQAERWARRKTKLKGGIAAVLEFVVSRDSIAELSVLTFVLGKRRDADFWSLAHFCHNGGIPHGRTGAQPAYDVVFGPLLDYKVRQPIEDTDQVSFHTPEAQDLLNIHGKGSIVYP